MSIETPGHRFDSELSPPQDGGQTLINFFALWITSGTLAAAPGDHVGQHYARAATSIAQVVASGRVEAALVLAEQAVRDQIALFGRDHLDLSRALDLVASLHLKLKQYDEAETAALQSLRIVKMQRGAKHPACASLSMEIAEARMGKRQWDLAEPYARDAVDLFETNQGEDSLELAVGLSLLGKCLLIQNHCEEASAKLGWGLAILSRSETPNERLMGGLWEDYAVSEAKQNHLAEAERATRLALELKEKQEGAKSPKLIPGLNLLVHLCQRQNRNMEVCELLTLLLDIKESSVGSLDITDFEILEDQIRFYQRIDDPVNLFRVQQRIEKLQSQLFPR